MDCTVVDLSVLFGGHGDDQVFAAPSLNPFMAQGPARWARVRERLRALVAADLPDDALHPVVSPSRTPTRGEPPAREKIP